MKRVLTFLAILLLPLSVWAMTPVTDSDLSNVTGQAGVNINADLTMNIGIGTLAWGDEDGLDGVGAHPSWVATANGGYVGITDFNITNLRIKARTTDTYNGYVSPTMLKPITIDVAQDPALYAGRTFVRIGLGSLQVTLDALQFNVELGQTPTTTSIGDQMGIVSMGAIAIYINPSSFIDIYTHGGSGVSMTMAIVIDEFQMDYVSWGDSDGIATAAIDTMSYMDPLYYDVAWMAAGAASTAGYVGLDNLVIGGPITISGTVAIDVVTSLAGIYAHGVVGDPATPSAAPVTVVQISFPSLFNVNVAGPITADVKLSNAAALNGTTQGTLGDIYIAGFNLDILGGSWVHIWAH